jgi:hypothetical protein
VPGPEHREGHAGHSGHDKDTARDTDTDKDRTIDRDREHTEKRARTGRYRDRGKDKFTDWETLIELVMIDDVTKHPRTTVLYYKTFFAEIFTTLNTRR